MLSHAVLAQTRRCLNVGVWHDMVIDILAIIIAVLIVVNAQDKRDRPVQQETSTSTTVIGVPPKPPPSAEPSEPQ